MKICQKCKKEKEDSEFYKCIKNKTKNFLYSYCVDCSREKTTERKRKYKERLVNYFGGKCEKCGYDKCLGALEFHHLNPNEKDPSFENIMRNSSFEKQKETTKGCILVCSNCHREIHYKG